MAGNENYSDFDLTYGIKIKTNKESSEELNEIILKEKQISYKANCLDLIKFRKLFLRIKLMLGIIKDFKNHSYNEIPWKSLTLIIAAILYFLNPFDLIPDTIPLIGFTDDAAAIALVFNSLKKDISKYCVWKGISEEGLF